MPNELTPSTNSCDPDLTPSPNGGDGHSDHETANRGKRDNRGRFASGNKGGPGNPYAARVGRWRAIMTEAVTDDDLRAVVAALVAAAKRGESWAVKEVFDRTVGKPVEADLVARLELLESHMQEPDHAK